MISTLVRHAIYDFGLNVFFSNLISNFSRAQKPNEYIGKWFVAKDKDDDMDIYWGLCTEVDGNIIVLEDDDGCISVCHQDLFIFVESTEEQCIELSKDEEELLMTIFGQD